MKQKNFVQDNLGKGINTFTRDTMINDNECAIGLNVWAIGKNSVAKRPGSKLMCEVASADDVKSLGTYYTSTVRELLIMSGGKLYKEDSGSATRIGTQTWTDTKVDFCQAGGIEYIASADDGLRKYDGSTTADVTNGKAGSICIFYKGCLWVAGDPDYPTRLYRSGAGDKIGDFTYADPDNLLATSVFIGKDDGQKITGLFKHQDYLYVAKENSLWRVTQSTDEMGTITVSLVDPSRGAVEHRTIDSVENDVFFFNDVGAYAFGYEPNIVDQIRTNIVSLRVDDKVKAVQKDRLDEVCGIYFDNHYYLSYTEGGGSANDRMLVYDRQRLSWWEWDLGAACFTEFKDSDGYSRLYFGSSTDGKVYYFDETALTDNETEIETDFKTGKWSFKDYVQQKFFHHLVLYFNKQRGYVTINVYVDGDLHYSEDITLGAGTSYGIGVECIGVDQIGVSGPESVTTNPDKVKIPVNKMGASIQVQVTDSDDTNWELNAIEGVLTPINVNYVKV